MNNKAKRILFVLLPNLFILSKNLFNHNRSFVHIITPQ